MSTILVLDRERDTYQAVLIKDRVAETNLVKSAEELKAIYQRHRPSKTIYLIWPEQSITKVLTLPVVKKEEIETALEFEMEEDLPLSSDNYHFIHTVLKKDKESTLVLGSAFLKEPIDREIEYLQNAGVLVNEARLVVGEVLQWCLQNINDRDFVSVVKIKDSYLFAMFQDRVPVAIKTSTNRSFIVVELEKLKKVFNSINVYWSEEEHPEGTLPLPFDI
ncbi:MAG: hypothetical protein D6778_10525, partial [Nitrospirae bacterium]